MALKSNISDYEIQFEWLLKVDKKSPECYNNRKNKGENGDISILYGWECHSK